MRLLSKLTNWRELFITIVSAAIITFGQKFGLNELAEWLVAAIGGTYVGGAALATANINKRLESVSVQFKSKKFRQTVVALAIVVGMSFLGFNVPAALAALSGAYNLFQGYSDRFADDPKPEPAPKRITGQGLSPDEIALLNKIRKENEASTNS